MSCDVSKSQKYMLNIKKNLIEYLNYICASSVNLLHGEQNSLYSYCTWTGWYLWYLDCLSAATQVYSKAVYLAPNAFFSHRPDRQLQDIVYKMIPYLEECKCKYSVLQNSTPVNITKMSRYEKSCPFNTILTQTDCMDLWKEFY